MERRNWEIVLYRALTIAGYGAAMDDADGLTIPAFFSGLSDGSPVVDALRLLAAEAGDPAGLWFVADNLITFAHAHGFLTEPRFVAAVRAARPEPAQLAIAWRTHTLCWAAESCRTLEGDFVECGTYQGYSMSVVLHYLDGLRERRCWLYDLFDPAGGPGEGERLSAHSATLFDAVRARFAAWDNVRVIRGKVPAILEQAAPSRVAFMHIDMNSAEAERGALELLFDRMSTGGMVVLDDYGWTGYGAQKDMADRFMQARGLSVLELPTGQGLVVKR